MSLIPAIIHQTWKTKTGLSDKQGFWRASFRELNPGFFHPLYDDADNLALVRERAPSLLAAYEAFPREIYRVDMVRALYLFFHGGFYADLDFQCLRPFEKYCASSNLLLGRMGTFEESEHFGHEFPNAMMASPPFDAFWLFYISQILKAQARMTEGGEARVEYVTGSVVLRAALLARMRDPAKMEHAVKDFLRLHPLDFPRASLTVHAPRILPSHVWYPINWADNLHRIFRLEVRENGPVPTLEEARRLFPYSDAVTYWQHSW